METPGSPETAWPLPEGAGKDWGLSKEKIALVILGDVLNRFRHCSIFFVLLQRSKD